MDLTKWLSLWEGYNRFYNRHPFPMNITQTTWMRFLDINEPIHAIVAEQDGQLLGLAHYIFHQSTNQINYTCYLQDLFTDGSARGQGVAKMLMEGVLQSNFMSIE